MGDAEDDSYEHDPLNFELISGGQGYVYEHDLTICFFFFFFHCYLDVPSLITDGGYAGRIVSTDEGKQSFLITTRSLTAHVFLW
jgi:hypothetical protein